MLEGQRERLQVQVLKGAKLGVFQHQEGLGAEAHAHQVDNIGVVQLAEDGHLLAYQLVGGYPTHFCYFQTENFHRHRLNNTGR